MEIYLDLVKYMYEKGISENKETQRLLLETRQIDYLLYDATIIRSNLLLKYKKKW